MAKIENKCVQDMLENEFRFSAKDTEQTFRISNWVQPLPDEKAYAEFMECGFNAVCLNQGKANDEIHKKELVLCEKFGLPAYISLGTRIDEAFEVAEYKNYAAFAGFMIDEPVVDANNINGRQGIKEMGEQVEEFERVFSELPLIINLNPARTYWVFQEKYTYDEYLEVLFTHFLNKTKKMEKWLSADDYPLYYDPNREKDKLFLYEGWLCQLESMAYKKTKYNGVKTHMFIQSMPYLPEHVREVYEEDLRMQMYACLAFAFDGVSYFTYNSPPITPEFTEKECGLIDRAGNKTPLWYGAKKVNEEIKKLGKVYFAFSRFCGALTLVGENNKKNENYENPSLVLASPINASELGELKNVVPSEDLLVSMLGNDEGRKMYVLVNYNDTSKHLENKVELTFAKTEYAYVYINGICKKAQLENGKLYVNLGVGEGVFVIPDVKNRQQIIS